jgi:hypothetical protein
MRPTQHLTTSQRWPLNAVRYGLPATLLIAGLVVLLVDTDSRRFEGFAMLVGSGLSVALTSVLFRLSASDEREREDEDHAREYLAQHGYWPDEARDHEDHQDQEGAGDAGPRVGSPRGCLDVGHRGRA